jgi:hypothetical protein
MLKILRTSTLAQPIVRRHEADGWFYYLEETSVVSRVLNKPGSPASYFKYVNSLHSLNGPGFPVALEKARTLQRPGCFPIKSRV